MTTNILLPNTATIFLRDRFAESLILRADLASLCIMIASGQFLIREFFPLDMSRKIVRLIALLSSSIAIFALVFPALQIEPLYRIYVGCIGFICLYSTYIAIRVLILKRSDARLMGASLLIVGIAGGADVLTVLQIWHSQPMMLPAGLLVMTGIMSFMVARRFTAAFFAIDRYSTELKEKNEALLRQDTISSKSERIGISREIMEISVAYWETSTGKSKLMLARESGLWVVEVTPDGFERARTLDRYLDTRTFPDMPRWKKILATGDFVLAQCTGSESTRQQLKTALNLLRKT
jgi:hypothetical protein